MSTSPASNSPQPTREAQTRYELHSRVGVQWAAKAPARPKRRVDPRWILLAMMLAGLVQGSYFVWAGRSALAAAPIFRGDASCKAPKLDSSPRGSGGACRLESAVVAGAYGGRTYSVITISVDGTRDYSPIAAGESRALWRRVQRGQRVVLQRFVAPGYYLTGKVTGIADSVGFGMTRYHPDSRTHYEAMYATVGMLMFACTLALIVL